MLLHGALSKTSGVDFLSKHLARLSLPICSEFDGANNREGKLICKTTSEKCEIKGKCNFINSVNFKLLSDNNPMYKVYSIYKCSSNYYLIESTSPPPLESIWQITLTDSQIEYLSRN